MYNRKTHNITSITGTKVLASLVDPYLWCLMVFTGALKIDDRKIDDLIELILALTNTDAGQPMELICLS